MTILTRSINADALGTATVTFADVPTGIQWVIAQVGVEVVGSTVVTTPVTATIKLNGRLVTSTNQGAAGSAGGQPFLSLKPGDVFTVSWRAVPVGYSCVANLYYSEIPNGSVAGLLGVV